MEKARPFKSMEAARVALPQDEFFKSDALSEFVEEFEIDHLFSVAAESEWPKIYPDVDPQKVGFSKVLTGYLDEGTVSRIEKLDGKVATRDIDIGYRAWRASYWLGRHGHLKAKISEVFKQSTGTERFVKDISTRNEDVLEGDTWYEFLVRCKYTLGVEGGASVLDRTGAIRSKTDEYVADHPDASFEEVEAACFPGLDGGLELFAVSPRHLEACATRTCQVLIEGDYDGVLSPGRHYIELKRDFSNLQAVLEIMRRDEDRAAIVDSAYRDVVESGLYSYKRFVAQVLDESLQDLPDLPESSSLSDLMAYRRNRLADRLSWLELAAKTSLIGRVARAAARGPAKALLRSIGRRA